MPPRLSGWKPAETPAKPVMLKHAFLQPTAEQKKATAAAAAAKKAAAKKAALEKQQAKLNDRIFAARQDAATKKAIFNRVTAQHGLAPAGTGLGQKGKVKDPLATPTGSQIAVAKQLHNRLTHGGLLTDAQRLDEYLGEQGLAYDRPLRSTDKDQLPDRLRTPGGNLPPGRPVPESRARPDQSYPKGRGLHSNIREQSKPTWDIGKNLQGLRTGQVVQQVADVIPALKSFQTADAASKIASKGVESWQSGLGNNPADQVSVALKTLNPNARVEAKSRGLTRVPLSELSDTDRYGEFSLGTEYRKYLAGLAVNKQGYNAHDVAGWNDPQLIARAFIPNDRSFTGLARNAFQDMATQGALLQAPRQLGSVIDESISERSPVPALQYGAQMAQGFISRAPVVGDRPWIENLYDYPVTTIETLLPFTKFAGVRAGRMAGIKAYRDVELPTTRAALEAGHKIPKSQRTVPVKGSQHIVTRGVAKLGDRIMAGATHPDDRRAREQLADFRNPPRAIAHQVAQVPQRIGHRLAARVERNEIIDPNHMMARALAGQEPHLAGLAYLKSIRQHPWVRHLNKWGGQEEHIESGVLHGGASVDSVQLAEMYSNEAKLTEGKIEAAKAHAEEQAQREKAAMESFPRDHATAAEAEANATFWKLEVKKHEATLKRQNEQIKWLGEHPMDPQALDKHMQAVVDSARNVSEAQAKVLMDQHIIDEKGKLYGDWQYRIAAVHSTEGPGSARAIAAGQGETGTTAYQIADRLDPARQEFLQARAAYHGITGDAATDQALSLPHSEDIRTHVTEHEVGRSRFARNLLLRLQKQQARVHERMQRVATRGGDPLGEAISAGVNPRQVQRAINEATGKLEVQRNYARTGEHSRHANLAEEIEADMREQMFEHEQKHRGIVNRKERALEAAKIRKAGKTTIDALTKDLEDARAKVDEFVPNENLLRKMRDYEKGHLRIEGLELNEDTVAKIVDGQFRGRTALQPHQRELVMNAVQHALDREVNLGPAIGEAQRIAEDAAGKFHELSGGKDIEVAHRFDRAEAHYRRMLRDFRDEGVKQGHNPFHLHMHKPDTNYGLQPVRVSQGTQWLEADYTRDMHFLISRDIEGLARNAVSAEMFNGLSESPLMITNPPVDSVVPPGWFAVDKDLFENLTKTTKSADEKEQLMREWKENGNISHEGQQVGENTILMTRNLKDWVQAELKRGDIDHINPFLAATNRYRRWMLFSLPRTFVNNALGNPLIAMMQGAGLRTWYQSVRTLQKYPERVPVWLRRKGVSANIMENPNSKMVGWQAYLRHHNMFQEDNGNLMVYLLHAKKAFKKKNGLRWFNKVSHMDEEWGAFLKDAAEGNNRDALAWGKKSAEMFGDMFRMSKHDNVLATSFLFHRWVGHMIHLTWWTMPLKYPGRTLFLQQTAYMADEYRKKHGIFPDWAAGYIPLWNQLQKAGGLPQNVTWALSSSGVNPWATSGQSLDMGDVSQQRFPLQSFFAANLNPLLRIIAEAGTGRRLDTLQPFKNHEGHEIGGLNQRVLLNSVIGQAPVLSTIFPRAGLSDDSIQIPGAGGMWPRYLSAAKFDPSMNPPQAVGHGILPDIALFLGRATGVNIRPLDAAGNRTQLSGRKTIDYQSQQASKRITDKNVQDFAEQMKYYKEHGEAAYEKKYGKP